MEFNLDTFVDKILEEQEIVGVSEEVYAQLKQDLLARTEDMINAEILRHMPEDALAEFEKILETGTDDEVQAFCASKIANLDTVVAEALIQVRALYLTKTEG